MEEAGLPETTMITGAVVHRPVDDFMGFFSTQHGTTELLMRSCAVNDDYGNFTSWNYSTGVGNASFRPSVKFASWHAPAISPDGRWLALPYETVLRILDATTGRQVREFIGHQRAVLAALFLPDGRHIITVAGDSAAAVWEVNPPADEQGLVGEYFQGHEVVIDGVRTGWSVTHLAISPDGKLALTGDDNGIVILWEIETRKIIWRIPAVLDAWGLKVYRDPDREPTVLSVVAATGEIIPDDGSPVPPQVRVLAFFPDGSKFVATDSTELTRVFDTRWGWEVARREGDDPLLGYISELAVSPDGRWILIGSNPVPRLWDWRSGETVELHGHREANLNRLYYIERGLPVPPTDPGGVRSVTFSPDGKLAITGGEDGTIRLWQLPPHEAK